LTKIIANGGSGSSYTRGGNGGAGSRTIGKIENGIFTKDE